MIRYTATPVALLALAILLATGPARAEPKKLTAAGIAEALAGNTIEGLWGATPYRSYFDADGTTLYQAEGRPVDRGRWRADAAKDQYCSWWEQSGWSCYEIYREGETIIWAIPRSDTRYPSTLLEGRRL